MSAPTKVGKFTAASRFLPATVSGANALLAAASARRRARPLPPYADRIRGGQLPWRNHACSADRRYRIRRGVVFLAQQSTSFQCACHASSLLLPFGFLRQDRGSAGHSPPPR